MVICGYPIESVEILSYLPIGEVFNLIHWPFFPFMIISLSIILNKCVDIKYIFKLLLFQVELDDSKVLAAAGHAVTYINSLTDELRVKCTELSLKTVLDAKLVAPNELVSTGVISLSRYLHYCKCL